MSKEVGTYLHIDKYSHILIVNPLFHIIELPIPLLAFSMHNRHTVSQILCL